MAMLSMMAKQQCSAPPGRLAQLSPPHWPHVLSQQTTPSCASTPLAHQVEATISSSVAGSSGSSSPSSLLGRGPSGAKCSEADSSDTTPLAICVASPSLCR